MGQKRVNDVKAVIVIEKNKKTTSNAASNPPQASAIASAGGCEISTVCRNNTTATVVTILPALTPLSAIFTLINHYPMKDILHKMTGKISDVKDTMIDSMKNMLDLETLADKFSGFTEASANMYAQYTSDLIALSPIIEEIGFKTSEIEFNISIPPSFTFHFQKLKDTTPEKKQEILDLHKENRFLAPIVKMLITADSFQDKVALGTFKFRSVKINLGLSPGLHLTLVPKAQSSPA